MKIKFIYLLCFLSLSFAIFGQKKNGNLKVEAVEKQRFEAMQKKDIAFLKSVLADDLVYTHSNALVESKTDFIQSIETGKIVYEKMEIEEIQVRNYNKNLAIINGLVHVIGSLNSKAFDLHLRYTDVYLKQDGQWKLLTWQSTKTQ